MDRGEAAGRLGCKVLKFFYIVQEVQNEEVQKKENTRNQNNKMEVEEDEGTKKKKKDEGRIEIEKEARNLEGEEQCESPEKTKEDAGNKRGAG